PRHDVHDDLKQKEPPEFRPARTAVEVHVLLRQANLYRLGNIHGTIPPFSLSACAGPGRRRPHSCTQLSLFRHPTPLRGVMRPAQAPHILLSGARLPLNWFRSHKPTPSTRCGSGPCTPSVYCQNVHVRKVAGMFSGFGPLYCAIHKKQLDKTGSGGVTPANCSLIKCPE